MAMMDKLKDKLPGKKYGKEEEGEGMAKPAGIEIEIGEDESEDDTEGIDEAQAEDEVSVGELAKLSDEELLAEVKKRGLELGKEQEEMPEEEIVASPSKNKPMA